MFLLLMSVLFAGACLICYLVFYLIASVGYDWCVKKTPTEIPDPPNAHILGCYCGCHSHASSRMGCEHCRPELFSNPSKIDNDIQWMTRDQLKAEIVRNRAGIRKHRDQRLDDRCWMDDFDLYGILPEGVDPAYIDLRLLPKDIMRRNCHQFIECRSVAATPEEAVLMYRKKLTQLDGDGTL